MAKFASVTRHSQDRSIFQSDSLWYEQSKRVQVTPQDDIGQQDEHVGRRKPRGTMTGNTNVPWATEANQSHVWQKWEKKRGKCKVSTLVQATLLLTITWTPKEVPWK